MVGVFATEREALVRRKNTSGKNTRRMHLKYAQGALLFRCLIPKRKLKKELLRSIILPRRPRSALMKTFVSMIRKDVSGR